MAYEITISKTGKNAGAKGLGGWQLFDRETKTFRSKREAMNFLRTEYAKKRRVPIYRDAKGGKAVRVGSAFKLGLQRDWSHSDSNRWYQQDWVEMNRVRRTPSLFKF